jgi:hypothetical protein
MNNDYKLFYVKLLCKIREASNPSNIRDMHLSIQQKAITPKTYKSSVYIHPLFKHKKAQTPIVTLNSRMFKNERLKKITKDYPNSTQQNRSVTPNTTTRRKIMHKTIKSTTTEYQKIMYKRAHLANRFTPEISQIQGTKINIHIGRPYQTLNTSLAQTPRRKSKTQLIVYR